jgi:hypothetical protein
MHTALLVVLISVSLFIIILAARRPVVVYVPNPGAGSTDDELLQMVREIHAALHPTTIQ